jgi:adenylate cyclase
VTQSPQVYRKLAAILAADVVGYSRLMGMDEAETLSRLKELRRESIEPILARYHGRIVKLMGDGALVEFASVVDAVACAVEIQRMVREKGATTPENSRIVFRIGINLGDVIIDGDDVYGDGVNIAARLESLSEAGGIAISGPVYDQVHNKLDIGFRSLGDQHLKNIAEPIRVYHVLLDQTATRHDPAWRRRVLPAALLTFLALAAAASLWPNATNFLPEYTQRKPVAVSGKPSIAVLPFSSLSDSPQPDYLAEGLTDDLITDLSKISGLFVIARNSTFAIGNSPNDIRAVAEQLGVRYILQGSVRRAGDAVRINVQLIDAMTENNIWAERYDRDYAKIFALQDEVIARIVNALSVRLTESERTRIARLPTSNLEAYDFYVRAEQKVYAITPQSLTDAMSLYRKAIALDPSFADAYAGYARAIVDVLGFDYQLLMLSAVARQEAYDSAGRALQLNPQQPRAYLVLGMLQMLDGKFDEAIATVQKAITLDPNGADAQLNLAIILTYAGKPSEALAAMNRVLQLNPKPPKQVYDYYALVLYMNHQYQEALAALGSANLEEQSDFALEILAMTYVRLDRKAEAHEVVQAFLKRSPPQNLEGFRIVYGQHRRKEDLDHRMDALRDAGLPEWPFGFSGKPEDRLNGATLRSLAVDRTWTGHQQSGAVFFMQIGANGDFVQRTGQGMIAGKISFEGDLLCTRSAAILLGRKSCSPVFRNPGGTREQQNEYVFPDYASIWYFSVLQ